jgi:ankyrin repeat protein
MRTHGYAVLALALVSLGATGQEVPLIEAAKQSNVVAVRALLPTADVQATGPDGTTALHWAAHRNNLEVADLLLTAGAVATAANRYGVRPLTLAAENGSAALIERLLAAGADANGMAPGGETALLTASRTGNVDAIRVLLAHGADPQAREELRGQTPLMWAAVHGNAAAITALVAAGAEVHARSMTPPKLRRQRYGYPPPVTVKTGSRGTAAPTPVVQGYQLQHGDATAAFGALTPVAFAARRGHIDALRALLDAGADVNDTAEVIPANGQTPILTLAIANGHYEAAAFLLERGADPNLMDNGWTALHQLARSRAEPGKSRTNVGWTIGPTMTGSVSGLELAEQLLVKGANVNTQATKEFEDYYRHAPVSRIGATPLLMAARVSDAPLIRLLIEHGADHTLATKDGMTPLMATAGNGIRSPNEDGIDVDAPTALQTMIDLTKPDFETMNTSDDRGWTPMHGAAYRGNLDVIRILEKNGALLDLKALPRNGQPPPARARTDLGLNETGWLPVQIADGIVVGGIFFRQEPGAKLLRELMTVRGLEVPPDEGLIRGTYIDDKANLKRVLDGTN